VGKIVEKLELELMDRLDSQRIFAQHPRQLKRTQPGAANHFRQIKEIRERVLAVPIRFSLPRRAE